MMMLVAGITVCGTAAQARAQPGPGTQTQVTLSKAEAKLLATRLTTHGSWPRGPGQGTFSVCTNPVCTIHGAAGLTFDLTVEAWGAGGVGYKKMTIPFAIPTDGSAYTLPFTVGSGGSGGSNGGVSEIWLNPIPPMQLSISLLRTIAGSSGNGKVNFTW